MEMRAFDPETGESFRTNPCRDVSYYMPQLLVDVENRLNPTFLPESDKARLAAAGATESHLKEAYAGLCLFFQYATDPKLKSPAAALSAAGFFAAMPVCQEIVLQTFAKTCIGASWSGLRSAIMEGECPSFISALRERGRELMTELGAGRST